MSYSTPHTAAQRRQERPDVHQYMNALHGSRYCTKRLHFSMTASPVCMHVRRACNRETLLRSVCSAELASVKCS